MIWSVAGVTFTGAIASATAEHFNQSVSAQRTSEHANIKDQTGVYRSSIYHGFLRSCTITVVPAALVGTNTIANAAASGDAWLPQAGGVLTIVDANGAVIDGAWNIVSARQNRTIDGVMTAEVELEAGDDGVDITTTVAP